MESSTSGCRPSCHVCLVLSFFFLVVSFLFLIYVFLQLYVVDSTLVQREWSCLLVTPATTAAHEPVCTL